MWRFLFAVILVVACATVAAADTFDEADSAYKRGDYALAVQLFRHLAEKGDAQAQSNLGVMYHGDKGVPRYFVRAHM